jgi:DNA replication protein DnaC
MPAALIKLERGAKNGGMSAEDQDEALTQEQKMVKEKVMLGANIFLTGGAGTGKSFLVQNLIVALKRARGREAVAM